MTGPPDSPAPLRCPHCGYDLSGSAGDPIARCPECGLADLTRVQLRLGERLIVSEATEADLEIIRQRRLRRLQPATVLQMVMFWACIGAMVGFVTPSISRLITDARSVLSPTVAAAVAGTVAPIVAVSVAYWRAGRRPPGGTVVVRRSPPQG